jgi:hypothetical protein
LHNSAQDIIQDDSNLESYTLTDYPEVYDLFDECMSLYYAQQDFLVNSAHLLAPILSNFQNLSTIGIDEEVPAFEQLGSDFEFEGTEVRYLKDISLNHWLEYDVEPALRPATRNAEVVARMVLAIALGRCRIEKFIVTGHVCGSLPSYLMTPEIAMRAFRHCRFLSIAYDQSDQADNTISEIPDDNMIAQILGTQPPVETLRINMLHSLRFDHGGFHATSAESFPEAQNKMEDMHAYIPLETCESLRKSLRTIHISGFRIAGHRIFRLVEALTPGLKVLEVADIWLENSTWETGWPWLVSVLASKRVMIVQKGDLYQRVDMRDGSPGKVKRCIVGCGTNGVYLLPSVRK